MKKSILALAVVLGATTTFAQDLTSKKGETYLPEAGDYAIGIDAAPVLHYVGNFFGKSGDNMYANNLWNFNNPSFLVTGKYFVEEGVAYRGGIRLGFGSDKGSVMTGNRSDTASYVYPNFSEEVENTWKVGATNIGLTGGMEWRKGSTRLQGYYGGELGIMISSAKATYTYGNALTQVTDPTNVDVDAADDMSAESGMANLVGAPTGGGARVTEYKSGLGFGLGLRGFIGAEYFVIPKLSLGGEFGWGLMFMANGTSSMTMENEGFNTAGDELTNTFTVEQNNGSSFSVDTDQNRLFGPAGRVTMTFHF
jgi:hypothetical protein